MATGAVIDPTTVAERESGPVNPAAATDATTVAEPESGPVNPADPIG